MTNASKQKGTAFETLVLSAVRSFFPSAHRLGNQGAKDCGDIWLPSPVPVVIECKSEQSYAGKLSGWLAEAEVEARNAGKPYGVVVHKRRLNATPAEQYVTMDLWTFLSLIERSGDGPAR